MTSEIALNIIGFLGALFGLALSIFVLIFPLLLIYAIYRAIKGIMTHNAELKRRYENGNQNPENRWTDGQ